MIFLKHFVWIDVLVITAFIIVAVMFESDTASVKKQLDTLTENPIIQEYNPNVNKLGYRFYKPVNTRVVYSDQVNTLMNVSGNQVFMYIDLVEYVYGTNETREVGESEYYYYKDTSDYTVEVYPRNDAYQVEVRIHDKNKDVVHLSTNVDEYKIVEVIDDLLVIGNNVEVYDDIVEKILGNEVLDEPKELITKFNKLRETGDFDDYLVESINESDTDLNEAGE